MERDKARIKPFCDQLAQLWKTYGPDLRFGQIVSLLPAALRRPGHDLFYVEDGELSLIHICRRNSYRTTTRGRIPAICTPGGTATNWKQACT